MDEFEKCFKVIDNWRASHAFPLNTFQVYLRRKAREVDSNCLIAQRTKRLYSIDAKLKRFKWLSLSQMQDIGGCRAVLRSVTAVRRLVNLYHESSIKHRLDDEDDYINNPKSSGYRGYHLIYCYNSDKKDTYNDLKIEVQFRSRPQHAWATAVETVGTFVNQSLKSSQGEKDWLRFFALMGTAMALRERTTPIPGTPTNKKELVEELQEYVHKLDVETRLHTYSAAVNIVRHPGLQGARYFLLKTDPYNHTTHVTGYKYTEIERATAEYTEAERSIID